MRIMVTGSSGYLGRALVKKLREQKHDLIGIDVLASRETNAVGSITDEEFIEEKCRDVDAIIHTAALHKLHLNTHSKQQFIDVNLWGTQNLLEAAVRHKVQSFVYTSSTSAFGYAMLPAEKGPAIWVNEALKPIPKNIYGTTKIAAETLCQLAHQESGLNCIVLRTSRFFPKENDRKEIPLTFSEENIQAIEYLHRRAHVLDIVTAHQQAVERAQQIGFDIFIITATTPFQESDCSELRVNAPAVLEKYYPSYKEIFNQKSWKMPSSLSRVYDNKKAREQLEWSPKYSFNEILESASNLNSIL